MIHEGGVYERKVMKKKVVEDVIGAGGWENVDRTDGELLSCLSGRIRGWPVRWLEECLDDMGTGQNSEGGGKEKS